jgi:hypothetical protein
MNKGKITVVPNNRSDLYIVIGIHENNEVKEFFLDPIVAFAIHSNDYKDETSFYSLPIGTDDSIKESSCPVIFNSTTKEWWVSMDRYDKGEESLIKYLNEIHYPSRRKTD